MFDIKMLKEINFIPNERRIIVELIPEGDELSSAKTPKLVTSTGVITTETDVAPKTFLWEQFTIIPQHEIVHRPPGTVLKHRKGVVVAVNKGTYQFGNKIPSPFCVGDVVLININSIELVFFTDVDAWKKDETGNLKDRELCSIQEHTIIGTM